MSRKALVGIVVLSVAALAGVVLALLVVASPETLMSTRAETVLRRETVERRVPSRPSTVTEATPGDSTEGKPPRLEIQVTELDGACKSGFFAACNSTVGVAIARVTKGGPADLAGILRGDVIVAVDGQPVESGDVLVSLVESAGRGASLNVELRRFQDDGGANVLGPANVTVELPR